MTTTPDVVILGGGSGGYAAALRLAQLGRSVTLIERGKLGGTCLHSGCIPTKALLHAAELADEARASAAFGVLTRFEGIDLPVLNDQKERIVDRLYRGLQGLVDTAGITVVHGDGVLVGPTAVAVDGVVYAGDRLILATGATARVPAGIELGRRIVTSDAALRLTAVPESVVVVGGSVIGVEFASLWHSLGARVTVVEALDSLVPLEDPAISAALDRSFRRRGITVTVGTAVASMKEDADGVRVELADGTVLDADLVLVAVGRGPSADVLGLDRFGIETERGWVVADERLRTTHVGVYAVGDLVRGPQLAHRGFAHGIFVAEEIAGLQPQPVDDLELPRVTYCRPEIASVGLTEPQARERFAEVETVEYNLAGNGRSQILGTSGLVKLVREKGGPIVGVHMIGDRIGEQVGEGTLIVGWQAFPEDVARFIHAHPTQNEALGEAALLLAGKPLHAHA